MWIAGGLVNRKSDIVNSTTNPDQRAAGQSVKERDQITRRQVNAAARRRTADGRLVARAMNINVPRVRIHLAAAVEPGLKAFQPENARGDLGLRHPLPGVTDGLPPLENRPRRPAAANFFHHPMQAQRRAVRAFELADAKTRGGTAESFNAKEQRRKVSFKKRNGLVGDTDHKNKARWNDAVLFTGAEENL